MPVFMLYMSADVLAHAFFLFFYSSSLGLAGLMSVVGFIFIKIELRPFPLQGRIQLS